MYLMKKKINLLQVQSKVGKNMEFLISGTKSGLGQFLHANLKGEEVTRENREKIINIKKKEGVDIIIHCAWERTKRSDEKSKEEKEMYKQEYTKEMLELTQELLTVPHKKFIFISTIDVYPKGMEKEESKEINPENIESLYGKTKKKAEALIQKEGKHMFILRCAGLLGKGGKKNNFKKIFEDEHPMLTLTPDSEVNYVNYKTILEIIKKAIQENIQGIFNIASKENITIEESTKLAQKNKGDVTFGEYKYNVGNINTEKGKKCFPELEKTTKTVVEEFININ